MDDNRLDDLLPDLPLELAITPKPVFSYDALLPKPKKLELTADEADQLLAVRNAFVILGPAGGQALVCPGNQEDLEEWKKCPYAAKCPLLKIKKAPEGELCPIERGFIEQRFSNWCLEIGGEPDTLSEVQREFVASMVVLDVEEQRSVNILSAGEGARLTQVNITEAVNVPGPGDVQTILPLTWERVLHVNTELLASIAERRRLKLRDWMLTPEMQWKKAKAEGKAKGTDLGSQQAQRADKLRKLDPTYE